MIARPPTRADRLAREVAPALSRFIRDLRRRGEDDEADTWLVRARRAGIEVDEDVADDDDEGAGEDEDEAPAARLAPRLAGRGRLGNRGPIVPMSTITRRDVPAATDPTTTGGAVMSTTKIDAQSLAQGVLDQLRRERRDDEAERYFQDMTAAGLTLKDDPTVTEMRAFAAATTPTREPSEAEEIIGGVSRRLENGLRAGKKFSALMESERENLARLASTTESVWPDLGNHPALAPYGFNAVAFEAARASAARYRALFAGRGVPKDSLSEWLRNDDAVPQPECRWPEGV